MTIGSAIRATVGPASGSVGTSEFADFESMQVSSNIDDGCELSISARGDSDTAKIISELDTDVWVYVEGSLFQRFRVMSVTQTWGPDGQDQISLIGGCYRRIQYRRLLNNDLVFSGIGQGTIAWSILNDTQGANSGALGITQGTLTDTITRDRSYKAGENIGELLENLARVINGPRYVLGGDLVFSALAGDTYPTQPMPVALGVTALSMTRNSGSDLYANVVRGQGDAEQTTAVLAETASVAAGTEPRGRWEVGVTWGTVIEQTTVQEHTDGELQERTSPAASWNVTVDPLRWRTDFPVRAGDNCQIVVPRSTVAPIGEATSQVTAQCVDLIFGVSASGELVVQAAFVETPSA